MSSCLHLEVTHGFRFRWLATQSLRRAGSPGMKRLQPLLPETRSVNGCKSSSMHSPIVVLATEASGSICTTCSLCRGPNFFSSLSPVRTRVLPGRFQDDVWMKKKGRGETTAPLDWSQRVLAGCEPPMR